MKKAELCAYMRSYLENLSVSEEKCKATIVQYRRENEAFLAWAQEEEITKETVISYKEELKRKYKPATVNVKLAALNSFFSFAGAIKLKVKELKIQHQAYCARDRELSVEDYQKLVATAREKGNEKLSLLIQSICATGIRVSELRYITVEAVEAGEAALCNKGKNRTILLPGKLCKALKKYIRHQNLSSGPVFITRTGRPLNRSNIWRMMKDLCKSAGVDSKKVFPHNLRHLFARKFYSIDHDIAKLADILGHSSINTTRIYIITSSSEHLRQLEKTGLVLTE